MAINILNTASHDSFDESAGKEIAMVNGCIKKRYLVGRNACAVIFRLSAADAPEAKRVALVGDFNDWNFYAHPMRKSKNGGYSRCLRLEAGRQYRFRYIINDFPIKIGNNPDSLVRNFHDGCGNPVVAA